MRFVLIDRFVTIEPGRRATAVKTFLPSEDFLADHFPGFPVVPGVLLTEAMGQTAGWLIAAGLPGSAWPLLSLVDRARFHRFVRPGEEVAIEATISGRRGDEYEARTEAAVSGHRVADARLLFHAYPVDGLDLSPGSRGLFESWANGVLSSLGVSSAGAGA